MGIGAKTKRRDNSPRTGVRTKLVAENPPTATPSRESITEKQSVEDKDTTQRPARGRTRSSSPSTAFAAPPIVERPPPVPPLHRVQQIGQPAVAPLVCLEPRQPARLRRSVDVQHRPHLPRLRPLPALPELPEHGSVGRSFDRQPGPHGEPVPALDRHDPGCEPAPVQPQQPLPGILPALLVPVHRGRCQRQVQEVGGEPPPRARVRSTQPAVVRLRCRDLCSISVSRRLAKCRPV